MYKIIKPLLFLLSPETAHNFTTKFFRILLKLPFIKSFYRSNYCKDENHLSRKLFGLDFPNPVGLAAGFDKDGKYIDIMPFLGFGFIELGTVTPKPQVGNPLPRLFRLPKDKALINRMGFNNEGVEALVKRLKNFKKPVNCIIGGNIGKNKTTPNENAVDDYLICFNALFDYVDYFVLNVSSPNTPDLRALQEKEPLLDLLDKVMQANNQKNNPKPVLLKIAPDLSTEAVDDIISIVNETKVAGLIVSNTTIDRNLNHYSENHIQSIGNGGLSGEPVKNKSTKLIKYIKSSPEVNFPIIGVGGISSAKDAQEKIDAGADLIQIYTGLIYEGPNLVKNIKRAL